MPPIGWSTHSYALEVSLGQLPILHKWNISVDWFRAPTLSCTPRTTLLWLSGACWLAAFYKFTSGGWYVVKSVTLRRITLFRAKHLTSIVITRISYKEMTMFLTAKLNLLSGMAIGAGAVLLMKKCCKQKKQHQKTTTHHSSEVANPKDSSTSA